MTINELSKNIHANNEIKGFWDGGIQSKNIGEVIALIHSEASEALEADRKNHYFNGVTNKSAFVDFDSIADKLYFKQEFETEVKNSFEDELSDIVIRVLDLCGAKNINIEWHIDQKLKYNSLREYKHGKKY